jgi:hypothetical protein
VTDWYPEIAKHADSLTVFRACWADGLNHVGSVCQMNTGAILAGRPSLGAWINYGLGSANRNLPSFVVLTDAGEVLGGPKNWSSGFLPATFEGTQLRNEGAPILDLVPPDSIGDKQQRSRLDLLKTLNERFNADKSDDTQLEARINAYELAYRMQAAGPEAVDLSRETEQTRRMHGIDQEATAKFGTNCSLARRLVERGCVRRDSGGSGFGTRTPTSKGIIRNAARRTNPRRFAVRSERARFAEGHAGCLGREFGAHAVQRKGRRPRSQSGFTHLDGGWGIKGGQVIGTTDVRACGVDKKAHVRDITRLSCMRR